MHARRSTAGAPFAASGEHCALRRCSTPRPSECGAVSDDGQARTLVPHRLACGGGATQIAFCGRTRTAKNRIILTATLGKLVVATLLRVLRRRRHCCDECRGRRRRQRGRAARHQRRRKHKLDSSRDDHGRHHGRRRLTPSKRCERPSRAARLCALQRGPRQTRGSRWEPSAAATAPLTASPWRPSCTAPRRDGRRARGLGV